MKLWKYLHLFILSFIPIIALASSSPIGTWTTIDDKTGEKRAVVRIKQSGSIISGKIIKVYPQSGDTGICNHCPEPFKDKKIEGLNFLRGLSDQGQGVWGGGTILDPKTGKIYRAKITVEGNKLYVRGYVGVSALGRTQTWVR
ncbi:MAG: DUF2147 domain-containing protein [Legionella sp.]|nr:DUF2147 domain-containing protein [Legionella sp.]